MVSPGVACSPCSDGNDVKKSIALMIPLPPQVLTGIHVSSSVCRVAIITQPSLTVDEGKPFAVQPRVKVMSSTGQPVAKQVQLCSTVVVFVRGVAVTVD